MTTGHGLLCVGLTTLDIVAMPIDALPTGEGTTLIERIVTIPAGTAGGAAMVAARLGMQVALASAIGEDLMGRFVRLALDEAGVDTSLLEVMPDLPTSATVLAIDSSGRRPNFHALGAGVFAGVNPAVTAAASQVRHLHYGAIGGPRFDGGEGEALLASAKAVGAVVTCDLISPQPSAADELKRLLPHVDYFLPSRAEALAITGADSLEDAARLFLDWGVGGCIIKDGGEGCLAAVDGQVVRLAAYDIKPVDTTSCGDAFCAGFIKALSMGEPPIEACRFAMATAAQVAQGPGTLGVLTDEAGVRDAMARMTFRGLS